MGVTHKPTNLSPRATVPESDGRLCTMFPSGVRNDKPIIGIVVLEKHREGVTTVYMAASYAKFLESAGARVIPVMPNLREEEYKKLFNSINGVLFPGGSSDIASSSYARTAKIFYDLAIEANNKGDYFPIWGTCLGFQELAYLTSQKPVRYFILLITCCRSQRKQTV